MQEDKEGSFFTKSRLPLKKWLLLLHYWARQFPVKDAAEDAEVNKSTACDIYRWLREVCRCFYLSLLDSSPTIYCINFYFPLSLLYCSVQARRSGFDSVTGAPGSKLGLFIIRIHAAKSARVSYRLQTREDQTNYTSVVVRVVVVKG